MSIQHDRDLLIPSANPKLGSESQSGIDDRSNIADLSLSDQECSTGITSAQVDDVPQNYADLIDCTVEDAHDCIHLAWSLMSKCKSELPIMQLDIAVYMFRQVLNRCPLTYALHFDAQKRLVLALCMRFTHTRREEDLSESLRLCLATPEIIFNDIKDTSAANVAPEGQDYEEMECMMKLGRDIISNFSTSTSLDTLNTIIFLLQTSLAVIPTGVYPNRVRALVDLAAAHHYRFCHSSDPFDLENSISCLRNALKCCTHKNFTRFFTVLQLCAMLTTRLSHGGNVHHLREATELFRAEHDATTGHPLAMAFEKALLKIAQTSVGNPAPDITISLLREIIANRLESADHYDEVLHHLAEELLARYQRNGQQYDLDEAVLLNRRTLELRPSPHAFRCDALDSLAHALANRFDQSGQPSDLDELVSLHREALQLRHATHPSRPISLHNLAVTLTKRSKKSGAQDDLDEAVILAREALILLPASSHSRSVALSTLANALHSRFTQGGIPFDLEEAVLLYKEALALLPLRHSARLGFLDNLATALCTRFQQNGQGCDVDEAILLRREMLELCPVSHPKRSASFTNLANGLRLRFGHSGHSGDLDEAISMDRMTLELRPLRHPDRPESLNNLASALSTRFDNGGQRGDLDETILLLKETFEIWPSSAPGRYACIGDLATTLRIRFEHGGLIGDLDEAILFYREVIKHQNGHHPDRSVALGNLANALETRFEQSGQRSDLDEAISLNRQAFELDPPQHPNRPRTLHNLAVKLYTRFQQAKDWKDNDEVISLERQALKELPSSHSLQPDVFNVLANALGNRYEQNSQGADLDEAILLHREALGHPDPTNVYPMNLATTLLRRSRVAGHEGDLDEAILLLRKTVELRPAPHADRPSSLINLASALGTRFGRAHQPRLGDLDEAILLHKQAIEALPAVHEYRHTAIFNLAVTFLQAHLITQDPKHLDDAMSSFSEALCCPSQSSSDQYRTAVIWARHANQTQHASTFEAYDAAMQGLSQIAALSLDIQSRQDVLRADSDGLARSAARYAIEHNRVGKAIEYLEGGRTVFWSQVLHLRSPFDELTPFAPILADRLRDIAAELERGSHRRNVLESLDNFSKMSEEAESSRLRRLDEDWVKGLAEARELDGFEDFIQPRRLAKLQACADELPVVYLVPNDVASDCLILTKGKILHIPLSNMPMGRLRALVHMIKVATSQTPVLCSSLETANLSSDITEEFRNLLLSEGERASKRAGHFALPSDSVFHYVLHILWEQVVKPVIGVLCLRKSGNPSTIRWCSTGPFTFLPIHAAGCYHPSLGALENASDYFVSTYIPTVGVILPTRNEDYKNISFKMMVVVDTRLPFANVELKKIKQRVPNDCLIQLGIPSAPAHADTVYNGLPTASIVHFACHGTQDRSNPLNSGLHVHTGKLTISKILQLPLTKGSLAFLCACQTAMGDENVPDEAMSIGASLLFAGFGSVVATMWNIADADGPTVADVFYGELFRGPDGIPAPRPEVNRSARALHIAVQNLRSTGVEFRRWVPFIHLGK